jgi:hydroxyethylthiazole kinase
MNFTANTLLTAGASPVMAHALVEVRDMVKLSQSLVVNIGTLSPLWVESMIASINEAQNKNIPVILDPVGAGATPYRNESLQKILKSGNISVIRGSASEIMSLDQSKIKTKGVDSAESSNTAIDYAKRIALNYNCVVCVSGETDYITDGVRLRSIKNGHVLMSRVTGMGCAATALIAAFAAIHKNLFEATLNAMAIIGIAGEIAAIQSEGPGSFQVHFFDELYKLSESNVQKLLKLSDDEAHG